MTVKFHGLTFSFFFFLGGGSYSSETVYMTVMLDELTFSLYFLGGGERGGELVLRLFLIRTCIIVLVGKQFA